MTGHVPTTAPDRMHYDDAARLRRLALTAAGLLPPHIAALVAKEITDHAEFGYALGSHGVVHGLVADLEDLARQRVQREAAEWAAKTAQKPAGGSCTASEGGCAGETCTPAHSGAQPLIRPRVGA